MSNNSTGRSEPKLPSLVQRVAIGPKLQKEVTREEVAEAIVSALNGHENIMQLGIFLIALRMRGERVHELSGIFDGLLATASRSSVAVEQLVELAEPFDGSIRHHNYCAFLPAVLATCGLPAFINGVHDCGPKHGVTVSKIYKYLGKRELPNMSEAAALLESADVGWAYCGQEYTAPALYAIREQRDLMVKRTALTTLERLTRPFVATAGKNFLHIGYVHKDYPAIYAELAARAGYDSVCMIKGLEGGIFPAPDKPIKAELVEIVGAAEPKNIKLSFDPGDSTLSSSSLKFDANVSCEAQVTKIAQQGSAALSGAQGNARKMLTMTGALILCNTGLASNPDVARKFIHQALDSGVAQKRFQSFIG
ncbi:MAG: hypothetical protein HOM55_04150 [Proteobacteria bacterium]|jgi:anthranilate phosphoribosyltransferase|nr:hypothetical protein [Pseudomonadota bacterium]